MNNKKILFFGGTGSLGNEFIKRNIKNNTIVNFSRDECKHWKLEMKFKVKNILGDIRDKNRVKESIKNVNPNIIIIASALKHIDRVEYAISESLKTNINGIQNILDSIDELNLDKLETVILVSTDKACSPINVYGMCKAIAEKMIIEKAFYSKGIKYTNVRYGNVLNSRGSIIPFLHSIGCKKDSIYTLTDKRMTRFIMTLEESCKLIEYAIEYANNGEIIIPQIRSMYIKDLFEIFAEIYKKDIKITGLRPGEKIYESLINGSQYIMSYEKNNYFHILPNYKKELLNNEQKDINSTQNLISKSELKKYLIELNLLDKKIISIDSF